MFDLFLCHKHVQVTNMILPYHSPSGAILDSPCPSVIYSVVLWFRCHFVSAQYLENKFIEFRKICILIGIDEIKVWIVTIHFCVCKFVTEFWSLIDQSEIRFRSISSALIPNFTDFYID